MCPLGWLKARREAASPRPGRRLPEAGVAALEFALLLPLLTMLLLGMFDYGKYMWVSINATQAAREGARELSLISIGNCISTNFTAAKNLEESNSGAAKTYMNQIGLQTATTVTATCTLVTGYSTTYPVWKVFLQVDFPPLMGYMTTRGLMPKGTGTTARVKATLQMRGF
jgi:Flp pilus assembly protein TadG